MAKAPQAGRVKTRLCPPCTSEEAAAVAEAALADTLDAVAAAGADRCVLALDGPPGPWLPTGFEVVVQRGETFGERLDAAWAHAGGPGLQIGMDTPQVTPLLLSAGLERLRDGASCLLGPAADGGWWAIGLQAPLTGLFASVPMSTADTGAVQRQRCEEAGLTVESLPELVDVDTIADAHRVAASAPTTRFASAVRALTLAESAP